MYSRYHQQAVRKYITHDPEGIFKAYKQRIRKVENIKRKRMIKKKAQEIIFTKWSEMYKLEKEFRNILLKKKKDKKRKVEQLIHGDTRIENIKQEYEQE